jgi:hypothetical protein
MELGSLASRPDKRWHVSCALGILAAAMVFEVGLRPFVADANYPAVAIRTNRNYTEGFSIAHYEANPLSPLGNPAHGKSAPAWRARGIDREARQASARSKLCRWSEGDTAVGEQDDNDDDLESTFFTGGSSSRPCHFLMPSSARRVFLWNLPTLFSSLPSKVGSFITFPDSSLVLPFAS